MSLPLVPLRIPSTWGIVFNNFVELTLDEPEIIKQQYLNEDLLSIERIAFTGSRWVSDDEGHVLDLGWYERQGSEALYRLVVSRKGSLSEGILVRESRSWQSIAAMIERCLQLT